MSIKVDSRSLVPGLEDGQSGYDTEPVDWSIRAGGESASSSTLSNFLPVVYPRKIWTVLFNMRLSNHKMLEDRVQQLCETLWPQRGGRRRRICASKVARPFIPTKARIGILKLFPPPDYQIEILRMGGHKNLNIGVTRPKKPPWKFGGKLLEAEQLILRIPVNSVNPRFEQESAAQRLDCGRCSTDLRDAAPLIQKSPKKSHPLGIPYMVYPRPSGRELNELWPQIPCEQRYEAAIQLGRFYKNQCDTEFNNPGVIRSYPRSEIRPTIEPFDLLTLDGKPVEEVYSIHSGPDLTYVSLAIPSPEDTPAHQVLMSLIRRWKTILLKTHIALNPLMALDLYDTLIDIANEMQRLQFFQNDRICQRLPPLHPRNIIANTIDDTELISIRGILDWDDALLAPLSLTCSAPYWLWGDISPTDYHHNLEDWTAYDCERVATGQNLSAEAQELKRLFDAEAGPVFRRFAYEPKYRLARNLFRLALSGVHDLHRQRLAEKLVAEWNDFRLSLVEA